MQSVWLNMISNMRTTEETINTGNSTRQDTQRHGRVVGNPALYLGAIDSVVKQIANTTLTNTGPESDDVHFGTAVGFPRGHEYECETEPLC